MRKEKLLLLFLAFACFFILCYLVFGLVSHIEPKRVELLSAAPVQPVSTPAPPKGEIDPTTASLDVLDTLPGIGPATAQAFHDYLQNGGAFHFPEDLQNVKGIGEKKLQDILPFLSITLPSIPPLTPLFP